MVFNYAECETISYEGMRLYVIDGNYYPSITTVLGRTISEEKRESLEKWKTSIGKEEADRIVKEAGQSGTNVHTLIERYLNKQDLRLKDFSEKEIGGFNCLKTSLNKISTVWGQEVVLYSKALGIAGRCDCVGIYESKPSIIDFKTSRKIKNERGIEDYFLQITAYALMHNEMFDTTIDNGVVLMGSGFGYPQVFKKTLSFFVDNLKSRVNRFYSLI